MLTDTKIKSLKPKDKAYKVYDGNGLYLFVTTTGAKSWRFDYKPNFITRNLKTTVNQ